MNRIASIAATVALALSALLAASPAQATPDNCGTYVTTFSPDGTHQQQVANTICSGWGMHYWQSTARFFFHGQTQTIYGNPASGAGASSASGDNWKWTYIAGSAVGFQCTLAGQPTEPGVPVCLPAGTKAS